MKDKENIKNVNKLSISYMMLNGLNGKSLENDNPFLTYLTYNMLVNGFDKETLEPNIEEGSIDLNIDINDTDKVFYVIDSENGLESKTNIIPNTIVHQLIEESYKMYKQLDTMDITNSNINKEISVYLDKDYDEFIDDLISRYKESLIFILTNFNSKKESYNLIKIGVFNNEMESAVNIEDYDKAIYYRDKIKDLKIRLEENKKESEN